MKFCKNCNNGLFPIEIEGQLFMVCKICEYKEQSDHIIIKKNVYKRTTIHSHGNNKYITFDSGYPRTKKVSCPNTDCPSVKDKSLQEAIYFNDPKNLKITYVCVTCNTEWKPS